MHIELHLGAACEVNAQVEQVLAERQQDESDKTGNDEQCGDAAEDLEVLEDRKALLACLAVAQAVSLRVADAEIDHAVEQEVGNGQRGKHGNDNADAERGGEADDRTGAEEEQHRTRDQGGDVGVKDRGERTLEAGVDRALDGLAVLELFLDAFEDDDVRVYRHADGQDDACDARQGEVDTYQAEDQRLEHHVEAQSDGSDETRDAVNDQHEQHDEHDADRACNQAGAHCVSAELRADRAELYLLEGERDLACVDQVSQLGCAVAGERAGDDAAVAVDLRGNGRRGDDLVVHDDGHDVGAVGAGRDIAGRLSELLLTLGGKLHLNVVNVGDLVAGRAAVAVGCLLDVRAGQPFLAVSVDKGQLCGGTEGLDSLLRVGDLRDLDRYTVVAGQGDGRLGEALVGQALTDDLLNRVHIVREVGLVVAVRNLCLVNDTGAAYQVKTQTDAVVGVEDARDDSLERGCGRSGVCGGIRAAVGRGIGGCRVRLRVRRSVGLGVLGCIRGGVRRVGLGGLRIPEWHGPAARNVHSRYRRNAEKTDQQQYSDKGNYTLFQ